MDPLKLPPPPWIVGHRGAAGEAPENTLESFLLAVEQGAHMVELDLQLTADGHLVAYHDWDLRRLTGVRGVVEEEPLSRLRELRVRGSRGRSGAIPTLEEALGGLPPTVPLNLELKRRRANRRSYTRTLIATLGRRENLLISSFDWDLLAEVRRRAPDRPLAPLADRTPRALLEAARLLEAWSVHGHRRLASPGLVEAASPRPLLIYTVNRPAEARRLVAWGVTGLFTDYPGRLRRRLGI